MDTLDREIIEILTDLKENHHAIAIKAEFESEGARADEVWQLKNLVAEAGLDLALTVGGCEALYDMHVVRLIGARRVVGPMIESPYALKKFLSSVRRTFTDEERKHIATYINVETIEACLAFGKMLGLSEIDELHGVVMGRVDLLGSMGLDRDAINSAEILRMARELFVAAKQRSLACGIGGGVAPTALSFFRGLGPDLLDHIETSKVLLSCPGALSTGAELGMAKAMRFELLWLRHKRSHYRAMACEDDQRIQMMESRYETAMQASMP